MKFREFIQPEAIVPSLQSSDRDGVIRELVAALGASGAIEADAVEPIIEALLARERTGTTGFGHGVAAPHCKHPQITRLVGTVGVSQQGLDFRSLDQKPVFVVFMLLSPQGRDQQHVGAMEVVFTNLQDGTFRKFLRQASTREKVMELLDEADAR